ncbi:MAG: TauD/TfdA family dioxygenase [Alphaproteobacteria bacterium]|nr:TauD/TfdA family dioxygenase [Alphaproteobacteria bacterium]
MGVQHLTSASSTRRAAPSAPFEITPLQAPLGAVVRGLDVGLPPSAAQILALKQAIRDHLILIFKDQAVADPDYLRFSSYFGTVYAPPADAPVLGSDPYGKTPDIVLVANVEDGVLGNRELAAHADHHWTPQPSAGSFLYALEVPPAGGDKLGRRGCRGRARRCPVTGDHRYAYRADRHRPRADRRHWQAGTPDRRHRGRHPRFCQSR